MKQLTDAQLKKMMDDIAVIKEALAKSQPSMELLFLPVHFRIIFLLSGFSIIIFSAIFYVLIERFGSFQGIPETCRYILLGLIFIDALVLGILKNLNWVKSLSHINKEYNFRKAYLEFFSITILRSYIPIILSMVIFIAYWILTGKPYYILPTFCIGIGILGNLIGNVTSINEYTLFGSWNFIWGFIIILTGSISIPVALACSLGLGMLLFVTHNYLLQSRRKR